MRVRVTARLAALVAMAALQGCGRVGGVGGAVSPSKSAPVPPGEVLAASPSVSQGEDLLSAEPRPAELASNDPAQPAPSTPTGGGARPKLPPTLTDAPHDASMLIYTANLTMAVYQVASGIEAVEQIGREIGGYLATRTDREIVLRVPRARFEDAIKKIEAVGDVVHRDIQAQDVTDEFLDTEVRLKNARAMRDRLQTLLERAPVKEALEIEKELGRVTQQIEQMEGRLKGLRDKIAYSTITVTFDARAASLHTMPLRLPFAWLNQLGLPHLLRLNEGK